MIYPQLLLRAVDDEDEANHIMYLSSAKGKVLRKSGGAWALMFVYLTHR
jgi:hypothetical protein